MKVFEIDGGKSPTLYKGYVGELTFHKGGVNWASTDYDDAKDYVIDKEGHKVAQLVMTYTRLADIDDDEEVREILTDHGLDPDDAYDLTYNGKTADILIQHGYDGIVTDRYFGGEWLHHFAVFDPAQITILQEV